MNFGMGTDGLPITEPCVPWAGGWIDKRGYGRVKGTGRNAHRVVYEEAFGPIPDDPETGKPLEIDHRCRNRSCVELRHLRAVPGKINKQAADHSSHKREGCQCGEPYDRIDGRTRYHLACKVKYARERREATRPDSCRRCGEPYDRIDKAGHPRCSACMTAAGKKGGSMGGRGR